MNIYSHTSVELLKNLLKTFNKNIKLRGEIKENIRETKGGEKLSWIKKWNSLFVKKWKTKKK
tara:strand:+ start:105 stop:290 length:186 start_codon:yes stop_codon:yes gene_type:complete